MIAIAEIFGPTVQGEGPLIGKPTVFVRTAGCDYRCHWCDTLYAVLPEFAPSWRSMTAQAVLDEILALSGGGRIVVSLSGGNPALQQLDELIGLGHARGLSFALETQGSLPKDWFGMLDWLFVSPKPPSSGETPDWRRLEQCLEAAGDAAVSLKVAVFDEADYAFAKRIGETYPDLPLYLQVGNPAFPEAEGHDIDDLPAVLMARYRWLVERIVADRWFRPTLLPQLHVLAWGNERGR